MSLYLLRRITEQTRTHCLPTTYLTTKKLLSTPTSLHHTTNTMQLCLLVYHVTNNATEVSTSFLHFIALMFYLQALLLCNAGPLPPTIHTHTHTTFLSPLSEGTEAKDKTRERVSCEWGGDNGGGTDINSEAISHAYKARVRLTERDVCITITELLMK